MSVFSGINGWLNNVFYEKNKSGDNWYLLNDEKTWGKFSTNLQIAQNHPILTPALLFISNLFAQGRFKIVQRGTNILVTDHWLLELLNSPNYYQSRVDFLESSLFMKIANGRTVIWKRGGVGATKPDSLYLLDSNLITYPDTFKTPKIFSTRDSVVDNQQIIYDKDGENLSIRLSELIFLYDTPNGINELNKTNDKKIRNQIVNTSRLDGLRQTLLNTHDSLVAKNIILKTNGKEMITSTGSGFPMSPEEKADAERLFNTGYGLHGSAKRGLITKANLQWKSMHVAMRDLGLDESVKVDGNIIYTALHIPKDILSLEAKKTTYNNYKESMVSFIQNSIQSFMNDFTTTLEREFLDNSLELLGSYEHLPVMKFIEKEQYEAVKLRAEALNNLLAVGIPEELALEITNFDKNIKLNERQALIPAQEEEESNDGGGDSEDSGEEE